MNLSSSSDCSRSKIANSGLRNRLEQVSGLDHEVAKLLEPDLADVQEQCHPGRIDDAPQVAWNHKPIESAERPDDQVANCAMNRSKTSSRCEWSSDKPVRSPRFCPNPAAIRIHEVDL